MFQALDIYIAATERSRMTQVIVCMARLMLRLREGWPISSSRIIIIIHPSRRIYPISLLRKDRRANTEQRHVLFNAQSQQVIEIGSNNIGRIRKSEIEHLPRNEFLYKTRSPQEESFRKSKKTERRERETSTSSLSSLARKTEEREKKKTCEI